MSVLTIFSGRNRLPLLQKSGRVTVAPKGDLLDLYNLLEAYYYNNGLYERLAAVFGQDLQPESLAALRTPAQRVVEFYTGSIWPGALPSALPIKTDNGRIIEPIQKIWQWSNWASKKQLAIRRFAMYGDMIIKVSRRDHVYIIPPENEDEEPIEEIEPSSVFMEVINPKHVPEGGLVLDERGNVIYIRMDVPKHRTSSGAPIPYTHTEIWTRETYRRYEHNQGLNADLSTVGKPKEEVPLSEFGIDFVPFVYAPFRMVDELSRGIGAYSLALDKIDEVNRMATRLHYLLFRYNKAVWALSSNMVDASGRPIVVSLAGDEGDEDTITLADDELLKLPGNSDIKPLIPALAYDDYLSVVEAQAAELENDLPELAYSRLRDKGELSGRAITLLLGDAIARAIEARGNAEDALQRAHKMALTMGVAANLFSDIGTYENGDFDHSFVERPIIRATELDKADVAKAYRDNGLAIKTALKRAGWEEEEIDTALAELAEEQEANKKSQAEAILDAARRYDGGQDSNGLEQPDPAQAQDQGAPDEDPNGQAADNLA